MDGSLWVSRMEAARIAGVAHTTIGRYVELGVIVRRPGHRGLPSLSRRSVESFAEWWAARREAEGLRREAVRARRAEAEPPRDGEVWLDTRTAALVLGVSPVRVRQLIEEDRLPALNRGGRWWLRRCDVEQIAAVRALWPSSRLAVRKR